MFIIINIIIIILVFITATNTISATFTNRSAAIPGVCVLPELQHGGCVTVDSAAQLIQNVVQRNVL